MTTSGTKWDILWRLSKSTMNETRLAHFLWFTYLRFLAVNSTYVCLRLVPPKFSVDCRCPLTIIFAKIKFMQNLKFSHAVTFDSKNSHYLFCDALQGLETVTFVSIVYFGHLFRQWQFVLASKSGGFFLLLMCTLPLRRSAILLSQIRVSSLPFQFQPQTCLPHQADPPDRQLRLWNENNKSISVL